MMVANPKIVDVACDWPGDQGCALTGDGDAAYRLPWPTDKLGWMGVYSAISVLMVGTSWTTGGTGLVGTTGGRVSVTLSTCVWMFLGTSLGAVVSAVVWTWTAVAGSPCIGVVSSASVVWSFVRNTWCHGYICDLLICWSFTGLITVYCALRRFGCHICVVSGNPGTLRGTGACMTGGRVGDRTGVVLHDGDLSGWLRIDSRIVPVSLGGTTTGMMGGGIDPSGISAVGFNRVVTTCAGSSKVAVTCSKLRVAKLSAAWQPFVPLTRQSVCSGIWAFPYTLTHHGVYEIWKSPRQLWSLTWPWYSHSLTTEVWWEY